MTVRDMYPLPKIDEIFDAMHEAMVFSKIDAQSGYHQVELKEEDKGKLLSAAN